MSATTSPPVTQFQEKVYALLLQIPRGRVTTYGAIARVLKTSPRAVGNALRNNPFAPEVPCHRCVGSTGFITGFDGESIDRKSFQRSKDGLVQGDAHQSKPRGPKISHVQHPGSKLSLKIKILNDEGVEVDQKGMVMNRKRVIWDGPWDVDAVQEGIK
ncbi:DNA binding methylated-DNA--cysteine S-methyltransferase [Trichoderma citrinoviride]|uniref:Methylated-DNA--protein-cysteine methyltransferase n=1 Tax=Trichoderma citrinoviride TaxID=58853 RepID=A0A2T4B6J7_9HYPO|nr:DNA binding methylated-DNA--cysteine S-methyltransferase [Trichoderma citrinoviride]PTB64952.1 DNA binding methylated-DNA--cysteine S-methyltransferase [Trichoderma citrinoviride]